MSHYQKFHMNGEKGQASTQNWGEDNDQVLVWLMLVDWKAKKVFGAKKNIF